MKRLSKKQVLEAPLRTEEFEAPEWGGTILLGEWPVERTAAIMEMFSGQDAGLATKDPALLAKLFVMGCVDPVFTEEDIPDLVRLSGAVIMRTSTRIMALNGLTEAAQDEARGKS